MTKTVRTAAVGFALAAAAAGCSDPKPPGPLTDEQKQKIKQEDERIAQEESGGKHNGRKGGGR